MCIVEVDNQASESNGNVIGNAGFSVEARDSQFGQTELQTQTLVQRHRFSQSGNMYSAVHQHIGKVFKKMNVQR